MHIKVPWDWGVCVYIHHCTVRSGRAPENTTASAREWCSPAHPITIHHHSDSPDLGDMCSCAAKTALSPTKTPENENRKVTQKKISVMPPRSFHSAKNHSCLSHTRIPASESLVWHLNWKTTLHWEETWTWRCGDTGLLLFSHLTCSVLGLHVASFHGLATIPLWGVSPLTHICVAADIQDNSLALWWRLRQPCTTIAWVEPWSGGCSYNTNLKPRMDNPIAWDCSSSVKLNVLLQTQQTFLGSWNIFSNKCSFHITKYL